MSKQLTLDNAGRMPETRQKVLLALPILVLATTYPAYQLFVGAWGDKIGYLAGFLFYWLFWCLLIPLWVLGRAGLNDLFRRVVQPFGSPAWLGLLLLIWPLLLAALAVLPVKLSQATLIIVVASAALALVNATLEELLWRGAYIKAFPTSAVWGWLYPSVGFAIWHLAPQSIHGNPMPGGAATFLLGALVIGLSYGWVAWRTGSIRWTVASHVLMNFLGLGATLYLGA
jgi:uncharacterized protein